MVREPQKLTGKPMTVEPAALPGKKYFRGRVIRGEQVLRYVVWDGIRNYENAPPLQAIKALEKMEGTQLHLRVDENAVEDIEELI